MSGVLGFFFIQKWSALRTSLRILHAAFKTNGMQMSGCFPFFPTKSCHPLTSTESLIETSTNASAVGKRCQSYDWPWAEYPELASCAVRKQVETEFSALTGVMTKHGNGLCVESGLRLRLSPVPLHSAAF